MITIILNIILGILGIVGTYLTWQFYPKRKIYAEIDSIYNALHKSGGLYDRRDKALKENNTDELTVVTELIISIKERKEILLERLK